MTIETKYNIGDEVWLMYHNKAVRTKTESVKIKKYARRTMGMKIETCITYDVATPDDSTIEVIEESLFPTKEELLKSL